MYSEKSHNTTHHGEMDVACQRISAKEPGEPAELHRLPDREPSEYGKADAKDHRRVKQTLHGIVVTKAMRKPEAEGIRKIAQHGAWAGRAQVARNVSMRYRTRDRRARPRTTPT